MTKCGARTHTLSPHSNVNSVAMAIIFCASCYYAFFDCIHILLIKRQCLFHFEPSRSARWRENWLKNKLFSVQFTFVHDFICSATQKNYRRFPFQQWKKQKRERERQTRENDTFTCMIRVICRKLFETIHLNSIHSHLSAKPWTNTWKNDRRWNANALVSMEIIRSIKISVKHTFIFRKSIFVQQQYCINLWMMLYDFKSCTLFDPWLCIL